MLTIIRYTLLTALRDWLFLGLLIILCLAYGLSSFMGSTALVEQPQMSLSYFAGASRIIMNIGLIVFVCFHVRRGFENREIESILSKPISRTTFVIAYWLGFAVLAAIISIPILTSIALLHKTNTTGLIYWGLSLILEVSILTGFALLTSLIMQSAVSSVLSTFAFYLISRLMGFFIAAMDQPTSLMGGGKFGFLMEGLLKIISVVIPRLDLYAKSDWLIYGMGGYQNLWLFSIQSLVFIPLIILVAIFDFKRKEF